MIENFKNKPPLVPPSYEGGMKGCLNGMNDGFKCIYEYSISQRGVALKAKFSRVLMSLVNLYAFKRPAKNGV